MSNTANLPLERQALDIAYQTRQSILSEDTKLSVILRRCLTIAQLLHREEENRWIRLESEGYQKAYRSLAEELQKLPDYRIVRVLFRDIYGQPIPIYDQKAAEMLEKYPIDISIGEIEKSPEGLKIQGHIIR
jgi:hypothetical protein